MKKLVLFIAKHFVRMVLLLICVSIVAFALVSISPMNPVQTNVGQAAMGSMSQEQIEKLEDYWGVNEPPVQRYLNWLGDFLRGDMGVSLLYRQDVSVVIGEKMANSLWLTSFAWIVSGIFGVWMGVIAGANRGKLPDKAIKVWSLTTASTPSFWLALILLMVFAVWLKLFPVGLSVPIGVDAASVTLADKFHHAVLPALALSIVGISSMTLHTRAKMADVMQSDYVLFAKARGESKKGIVWRHALRNIALPAMTLQFASIGEIIGGSILVEQVFSYPGLGQAAVQAGLGGDVPLLLGITMVIATIICLGNFIANVLYGVIDPRIRKGYAER